MSKMKEMFDVYKGDIEENLNKWLDESGYESGVKLEGKVVEDLFEELLGVLSGKSDFGYVMDEIDKDMMLVECCDWVKVKD